MAYSNTIGILIAAKDEASAVIAKTAANTKAASGEVNALGSASSATGSMLKTGLAVGLIAAAGESANLAIKFQQHMEMLHTNAGVAQQDIAGLSQKLLDMAPAVGQGPDQLAQAFYHIASAGTGIWTASQQLDILKVAAQGAAIGQADLEKTTYALTSAMSSGVGGVKNATEMMAVLNATVGAGDMKLEDLNGALSTGILSTAATFGISIQSVGTALATLTDNGEHADEAATRLRMTFALMGSPSGAATKQLEALGLTAENAKVSTDGMNAVFAKSGLSTTKLADDLRRPNGITAAMRDLEQHLKSAGLSSSEADAMLSKAFGGGRTDAALLTMLQNLDRMDEKYKVINDTAGNFSKNFADQQQTDAQKIKNAWATIQTDLTKLGTVTAPVAAAALTTFANAVNGAFTWYEKLSSTQKTVLTDMGLAALAIGGTVLAIKGISAAVSGVNDAFEAVSKAKDRLGEAADAAGTFAGKAKGVATSWTTRLGELVSSGANTAKELGKSAVSTAEKWGTAAKDVAVAWGSKIAEVTKTVATEGPKIALHAVDAGLAWVFNAIRVGIVWTEQMAVVAAKSAWAAVKATPEAIRAGAAWVASAATSAYAWVTVELPKIVAGFFTTSSGAVKNAVISSAAWVKNAAITSYAWVTVELPKIVTGFITTSIAAAVNAAKSSAAWVASAALTSYTWVTVELPKIIAAFVVASGAAVINAGRTSVAWVVAAATSSQAFMAFGALLATPLVMPAIIIAAALASIAAVASKFTDLMNQITDSTARAKADAQDAGSIRQIMANYKAGKITLDQKNQQIAILAKPNALGTSYWQGGMSLVGEHGPELVNLPRGSQVHNAQDTQKLMGGGGQQITINGMHIHNNMDEQKFLANLGWRLSLR